MAKKETWDISGVLKWVHTLRKREMWPSCIISVSLYSWNRRVYCMPLVSGIFDCCNVSNPFLPIFAHFRYWHRSSLLELLSLSCSKSASHSSGAMKWWVMRNGETQINHPSFCCVVLELFFFSFFSSENTEFLVHRAVDEVSLSSRQSRHQYCGHGVSQTCRWEWEKQP